MRFVRSILCAGLAMMAVGLCAAMPASAAVPMEIHAIIQPLAAKEYPVQAITVVQENVAMLPSVMPAIEGDGGGRSSVFASSHSLASTSAPANTYQHIDPDIAG